MLPYLTLRVTHCSGGYSFTSTHAANHFAMAMFVFLTLSPMYGKKYLWWLFVWAGCVAFAQVYVGVHYPFDVTGGALVGMSIGAITGYFFNRKLPLTTLS
jgi:undecaprenyl-diphosphatase